MQCSGARPPLWHKDHTTAEDTPQCDSLDDKDAACIHALLHALLMSTIARALTQQQQLGFMQGSKARLLSKEWALTPLTQEPVAQIKPLGVSIDYDTLIIDFVHKVMITGLKSSALSSKSGTR